MPDTETIQLIQVILQGLALLTLVAGLGFTIYQLYLFRISYTGLHDWNRRKTDQEAIDVMVPRIASDSPLMHEKFEILTKHDPLELGHIANLATAGATHSRHRGGKTAGMGDRW